MDPSAFLSASVILLLLKELYPLLKSKPKALGRDFKASIKGGLFHFSNNKKTEIHNDNRKTIVVVNVKDFKSKEDFKKYLDVIVENGTASIVNAKDDNLLEHIADVKQKKAETPATILSAYISPADLKALEASLLMRDQFDSKTGIDGIKSDIIERFGDRGRKIANLCTAGYFDDLAGLCKETCHNAEGVAKFKTIYETVVSQEAFAVFVTRAMSKEATKKAIVNKIMSNLIYGKKYVNIHGIGKVNVAKINAILPTLSPRDRIPKTKDVEIFNQTQSLIFIRLNF